MIVKYRIKLHVKFNFHCDDDYNNVGSIFYVRDGIQLNQLDDGECLTLYESNALLLNSKAAANQYVERVRAIHYPYAISVTASWERVLTKVQTSYDLLM